ncbi:undecaprenyl-diphosphatase UppP [Candidatus Peregrinibacteria bacterium]|nr:undecaprenyl-diphosphatase UppP [Candidatus Peregrinibacteria bacterium]
MNYFDSIIFGVVEGLTEFLPISSTGHLILTAKALGADQTNFLKSFEIAIQLGAILSVVVLYWRRLFMDAATLKRVICAFVPTAILGLIFYKLIKNYLMADSVVLLALAIGGAVIILFEIWRSRKMGTGAISGGDGGNISYKNAFLIGLFQAIAMIPGVSRAAATIIGGLALGINRRTIVEFSFLLAVPTMLAATGYDLYKSAGEFSGAEFGVLAIGFIVSFLVAILAIKFFLKFIQKHTFTAFGVYRILAAAVFWILTLR